MLFIMETSSVSCGVELATQILFRRNSCFKGSAIQPLLEMRTANVEFADCTKEHIAESG